jgi:hypothetical protein
MIQAKHDTTRLITATNSWSKPRLTRLIPLPEYPPVGQCGDMVCPEEELNPQVAITAALANKGRMGWHLDG